MFLPHYVLRARACVALVGVLAASAGCRMQTRVEAVRASWAYRTRAHWQELTLPSVELGPGGPLRQSITAAVTPRLLRGSDDAGRIEGAFQLRLNLWRSHREHNLWVRSARPFDPALPTMRRMPCGDGFHVEEYDGRGYTEAFAVGALVEGMIAASGRWGADGNDGRARGAFAEARLDGGFAAGVFARYTTPVWLSLNLDAGWEYAYGAGGPYVRAGVGLPFDLSVDRTQPRLVDQD